MADTIHTCSKTGDVNGVARQLADDPALLEARDAQGWLPLHAAAEAGAISVVRLLLEHGANVNAQTGDGLGYTPLDLAAESGPAELVHVLIDAGARIDLRNDYEHTPIHTAAIYGRPRALEALLHAGANPNDRVNGWTPLTYAEAHLKDEKIRRQFSATEDDYREVVGMLREWGGIP